MHAERISYFWCLVCLLGTNEIRSHTSQKNVKSQHLVLRDSSFNLRLAIGFFIITF